MNKASVAQQAKTSSTLTPVQGLLQRKCDCGKHMPGGGQCAECAKKKTGLQRKLAIGASNDPLEHEADRVAEQVMSTPLNSAVNATPPRIQRFSEQANEGSNIAPASVDHVLADSGRPLDPALQRDMGQRFGHDFSHVRVHTGGAAEQSAQDVNAHAYTVGNNIVFGAGRFSPQTPEGQRLLAHELTHTIQQRGRGNQTIISRATSSPTDRCKDMPKARPPLLIKDSVHPSVREAQTKLNLFHNNEIAAGRKGLSSAPLTEDCIFGQLTFNAVLAFQKQVFPGDFKEHDGKIGTKTWAKLDAVSSAPTPTPAPTPTEVPPKFICGPNVSAEVVAAIGKTKSAFSAWSVTDKTDTCNALISLSTGAYAWDIVNLHNNAWILDYRPSCASRGATPPCGSSIQINTGCYYAGSVNYVIFGIMFNLCNNHFTVLGSTDAANFTKSEMLNWINKYKGTGFTGLSTPSANFVDSQRWSVAGFDNWPAASDPPPDRPNCSPVCPSAYFGSTFLVNWVPKGIF